ncbi:Zn-dependent hydrolase [Deltaproteobacteria bacterium Smac51]|nr:Zn-dependent hydrolase [Deltaproteobacteria bacterium Smac51]
MAVNTDGIFWLGHDSFRVSGSRTVYFDPWDVQGPAADIILITHDHHDHCDPATVKALTGPKTKIFTERRSAAKLRAEGIGRAVIVLEPGDEVEVFGVNIKAVPAYNIGKDFHPKENNYLGFIVTMDGLSVYHAGDTDFIPEMKAIHPQVALLPVSGTYVMTAQEAVQAALAINPEVVIPMHVAKIVGDMKMAEDFAAALKGKVAAEIKPITA